ASQSSYKDGVRGATRKRTPSVSCFCTKKATFQRLTSLLHLCLRSHALQAAGGSSRPQSLGGEWRADHSVEQEGPRRRQPGVDLGRRRRERASAGEVERPGADRGRTRSGDSGADRRADPESAVARGRGQELSSPDGTTTDAPPLLALRADAEKSAQEALHHL